MKENRSRKSFPDKRERADPMPGPAAVPALFLFSPGDSPEFIAGAAPAASSLVRARRPLIRAAGPGKSPAPRNDSPGSSESGRGTKIVKNFTKFRKAIAISDHILYNTALRAVPWDFPRGFIRFAGPFQGHPLIPAQPKPPGKTE